MTKNMDPCAPHSSRSDTYFTLAQLPDRRWNTIPPHTGKEILTLPNAWPTPEIPIWRKLPYRDKLPYPAWHGSKLAIGKVAAGIVPKWEGAQFDSWDPHHVLYDTAYHPLADPALKHFTSRRMKELRRHDLITPVGNIRVRLKEYNNWRRKMFRYQHQLVSKKLGMARLNAMRKTIKGFIDGIEKEEDDPVRLKKSIVDHKQLFGDLKRLSLLVCSIWNQSRSSGMAAANAIENTRLLEELADLRDRVAEYFQIESRNATAVEDISDEAADPKMDFTCESNALIVELLKLHDLLREVKNEAIAFKKMNVRLLAEEKAATRRRILEENMTKKEASAFKRKVELMYGLSQTAKAKKFDTLNRRLECQEAMAERLDADRVAKTQNTLNGVDFRRKVYCGKQRDFGPFYPSGRKVDAKFCEPYLGEPDETARSEHKLRKVPASQKKNAGHGPLKSGDPKDQGPRCAVGSNQTSHKQTARIWVSSLEFDYPEGECPAGSGSPDSASSDGRNRGRDDFNSPGIEGMDARDIFEYQTYVQHMINIHGASSTTKLKAPVFTESISVKNPAEKRESVPVDYPLKSTESMTEMIPTIQIEPVDGNDENVNKGPAVAPMPSGIATEEEHREIQSEAKAVTEDLAGIQLTDTPSTMM